MIQALMTEPGRITFHDVPVPEVGADQIKVKVKRIGVCGSDIHVNHGKHPYTSYPVVQGHEMSAEIVEIGADVAGLSVGDKVTIQPQVVCGQCYPCTHGMYNDCENLKVMGFQTAGMASEYFVTEAAKAVKLPDDMSFEHGAMIEPLAVAVHAVGRYGGVKDKNVLVLGGGPIGNLVAQTVKAHGAAVTLLSEVSEYRLEAAEKCGIQTVDPKNAGVKEAISRYIGPDGADVIFECVGIDATMNTAIECARKGSDIVAVGVFGDLANINMGFVQDHELRITGTAMYRVEDYVEAVRLVESGMINLDALISTHVPFREYKKAYELIDKQKDKIMKVIIDVND